MTKDLKKISEELTERIYEAIFRHANRKTPSAVLC